MLFLVARQHLLNKLTTEYTLRVDEEMRSLLRAAAMTSHSSALVSTVTLL
jgi:uncharacterized protein (DUF1778 family)